MLYESIEAKRHNLDQMMWQTPALALVAQSFLLTIALGPDDSWTARLLAAGLGIVAALGSVQLLLKHRFHEEMHARWLERFARVRNWPAASPTRIRRLAYEDQDHPWYRRHSNDQTPAGTHVRLGHAARRRLVSRSSPYVWIGVLLVFAVAEASVFVLALVDLLGGDSLL